MDSLYANCTRSRATCECCSQKVASWLANYADWLAASANHPGCACAHVHACNCTESISHVHGVTNCGGDSNCRFMWGSIAHRLTLDNLARISRLKRTHEATIKLIHQNTIWAFNHSVLTFLTFGEGHVFNWELPRNTLGYLQQEYILQQFECSLLPIPLK